MDGGCDLCGWVVRWQHTSISVVWKWKLKGNATAAAKLLLPLHFIWGMISAWHMWAVVEVAGWELCLGVKYLTFKRKHNYIQGIFHGSNQWRTKLNVWSEFAIIALQKLIIWIISLSFIYLLSCSTLLFSFYRFSLVMFMIVPQSCQLSFIVL